MAPEITADDVSTWMWTLWFDSGHGDCAGWTYEVRDQALTCSCGKVLFRLELVRA